MALPFLPGMSFNDPNRGSFSKSQTLNFRGGSAVHDGRERTKKDAYTHAPPPPTWKTASGEVPPPWLAFDKKVLKYNAYFMESIPYSREPYRVRKCEILYYLEDGTLAVNEPKVHNSGILQGILVKRHKPTKADGTPLSYQDINTCMDLKIHGINYRIYETTDPYTIEFMDQMGYPVNGFEDVPGDPHTDQREFMQKSLRPTRPAKTGKDPLRQFLDFDGKVLRFYLVLDSRKDFRKFMLQYFLSDDTLSVVEHLPANCGRDPAPVFAKRQAPPKDFPDLQYISIGQTVAIFNHKFIIYDLDSFTQDFYRENYNVYDFTPIDISQSTQPIPQKEVPKHTGPGTEEDSLSSCLTLMPRAVKKDIKKSIENDKKILRFKAKMNSGKHTDDYRVFVISFYMADDTLSIYEPAQRNSGIVGGKFLERRKVKRPLKPPVLRAPSVVSSARPPSAAYHTRESDFTQTRQQNRPSPASPTLNRTSPTPYSLSTRAFNFSTTSGGYGYDPRKDMPTQTPSSPQQQRSRNTPPHSPVPPLSPLNTRNADAMRTRSPAQERNVNADAMRTRSPANEMSLRTRTMRTDATRERTSGTHEEINAEYYTANDFYIGGLIQVFNHVFVLQDADEFVLKHMEARPDEFPVSDINRILEKVREEMYNKHETTSEWLHELDPDNTGYVQLEPFKQLLRSICPDLVEQEIITVCRRYDLDSDGQISHEEFYTAVAPKDDF